MIRDEIEDYLKTMIHHMSETFTSYQFDIESDEKSGIFSFSTYRYSGGKCPKLKISVWIDDDFDPQKIKKMKDFEAMGATKSKAEYFNLPGKEMVVVKKINFSIIPFRVAAFILRDIFRTHSKRKGKKQWQHWKWNASTTMRHA